MREFVEYEIPRPAQRECREKYTIYAHWEITLFLRRDTYTTRSGVEYHIMGW